MVQLHVKATVFSLLRQYVREKNQTKQAEIIASITEDIVQDKIKVDQGLWLRIIDRMYEDKDVQLLKQRILEKGNNKSTSDMENGSKLTKSRERKENAMIQKRGSKQVNGQFTNKSNLPTDSFVLFSDLLRCI